MRCAHGAVTDLRIECETPKHRLYQALGALGILLYPVRSCVGQREGGWDIVD